MAQSSSEILDRFARQSIGVKVGVLVGVLALLTGGYYYFFYSDMSAEKDTLVAQKKKLVEDERRLLKRKTDYQELLKQKADAEDRLKKNAVKLPESSELPAFFQHLETQAATANVKILSRNIDKEMPVETYIKVPVNVEVEGDFYQINHYFALLAETSRIISIDNLKITDPHRDGDRTVMKAKFSAVTFRQADKPAQAKEPQVQQPATPPGTPPPPQPTAASAASKAPPAPVLTPPAPAPAASTTPAGVTNSGGKK